LASKAHRVAKGLVGGCALLLGVTLSGCAAPQYTYVANSGQSTYFKVPNGWHKISDSSLSSELRTATGSSGGGWTVAYEAGRKPTAGDFLSFGTAEPFVFAEVGQLSSGVHGVRETFDYTYTGGISDTFDEVALTNADQTVVYLLVLHCTSSCYSNDQSEINDVMSSFTIGSP